MEQFAIRPGHDDDEPFLRQMLFEAVRADAGDGADLGAVLADPQIGHYVDGWPRDGDAGVVAAIGDRPAGAAWYRRFGSDDPGYGFVDAATPEVSIGVTPDCRGQGIGRALLSALIDRACEDGLEALSLSVSPRNQAALRLYSSLGFARVGELGGSWTMLLRLR
jgi:GNAT superfamily N-acetyltransferase